MMWRQSAFLSTLSAHHHVLVILGLLPLDGRDSDAVPVCLQSKKVEGWVLFDWLGQHGKDARQQLQEVWNLFLDGTIQPYTGDRPPPCNHALCVSAIVSNPWHDQNTAEEICGWLPG